MIGIPPTCVLFRNKLVSSSFSGNPQLLARVEFGEREFSDLLTNG